MIAVLVEGLAGVPLETNRYAEALDTIDQLPQTVRAERARLGLSQRALAAQLRLASPTVTRLEKGGYPPSGVTTT